VIGLDLGTSSCKAVSYTLDGFELRVGRGRYATVRDAAGGARQSPSEWWSACLNALAEATVAGRKCLGIALGAQLGTYVALDDQLNPIEAAWTWQDGRSAAVLHRLADQLDLAEMASQLRTWLPLGPAWPLPRLMWLRESNPSTFERMRILAMPKDYVLRRLTGTLATDPSSWRGLVSPEGAMHNGALDTLGLPDVVAPRLGADTPAGRLLPEVASAIGLPDSVRVFVGTGDFACALVGTGVVDEGDSFDIGGTSEHIGILSTERAPGASLVVVPYLEAADPSSYVSYGVTSNGGSVTEWLGSVLLWDADSSPSGDRLSELAAARPHRRPLLFIPYLNGERSPIWDADACGAWVGLRADHDRGDLVRAAFEGVAFNLREIRDSSPLTRGGQVLRASGGTARSSCWNQIKADILQTPIAVVAGLDSASLGAAIHAATGSGAFATAADASRNMVRVDHVVDPDPSAAARYDEAFERYRSLATQLNHQHPDRNPSPPNLA
jgi:sugar (pentulose or hexulose) kinase